MYTNYFQQLKLRAAHTTLQQQAHTLGAQASEATEAARLQAIHHEQLLLSLKAQLDSKVTLPPRPISRIPPLPPSHSLAQSLFAFFFTFLLEQGI
jgi:hypothetical protein